MTKKIRNTNIELLRFLLIVGVCVWHLFIWGCDMRYLSSQPYLYEDALWWHLFICTLCSPSVYCFMLISGFYGIKVSFKKFFVLILTGFCCFIIGIISKYYLWGELDKGYVLTHLITVSSNQWWFLTSYVWVFLMSPFINKYLEIMPTINIKYILILLTIVQVGTFFGTPDMVGGSSFIGLIYM